MKDHKTDTENKTATRLRMSVRDEKPSIETPATKPKKGNGPKGNPSDRRSQKRSNVVARKEEIETQKQDLAVEWFGVNLASLMFMGSLAYYSFTSDTNPWFIAAVFGQMFFYNRRAFRHMGDLKEKK